MSKLLITGLSGNVGSSVGDYLNATKTAYVAGVREPDRYATSPSNVTYRKLDLEDPTTYSEALRGITTIFLVRPPQLTDVQKIFQPFIAFCQSSHVEHIVFLSLLGVDKNPFPPHHRIEKLIEQSTIHYTFIRPSFFMQNLIDPHGEDIRERNELFIPSGKALISFIDTRDIGEIIGRILTEDGHLNKSYTLTGSEAITYDTIAKIMSELLGRDILYTKPSLFHFRQVMIGRGIKKGYVNVMALLYLSTQFGMAKRTTNTAEKLLGRKPRTIRDFVGDYKEAWG